MGFAKRKKLSYDENGTFFGEPFHELLAPHCRQFPLVACQSLLRLSPVGLNVMAQIQGYSLDEKKPEVDFDMRVHSYGCRVA